MKISTTNYQPSLFDRAFVDVVEHLYSNKKYIQKFTTKKALLESLDIAPANYVEIKNGHRGVPIGKIDRIMNILNNDWDINQQYLKYRHGSITNNPINLVEEQQQQYLTTKDQLTIALKDLEKERAVNAELREMIKLQQSVINTLKYKKSGQ